MGLTSGATLGASLAQDPADFDGALCGTSGRPPEEVVPTVRAVVLSVPYGGLRTRAGERAHLELGVALLG